MRREVVVLSLSLVIFGKKDGILRLVQGLWNHMVARRVIGSLSRFMLLGLAVSSICKSFRRDSSLPLSISSFQFTKPHYSDLPQ